MNQHLDQPVLVVGSCNFDLTIHADQLPGPAETQLGGDYSAAPGGKGANQALGLHKLGSVVSFLSVVGKDHYGDQIREHLLKEGLDLSFVRVDDNMPTGLALITLDKIG
ncbi:MAG: PfkB family carbohydrate kinase, partial [Pseudomonadota bacterium]